MRLRLKPITVALALLPTISVLDLPASSFSIPVEVTGSMAEPNGNKEAHAIYTIKSNYRRIDVFSAKNTQSHFVIGELKSGETFQVLSDDGTWAKITFRGRDAYVKSMLIESKGLNSGDTLARPTSKAPVKPQQGANPGTTKARGQLDNVSPTKEAGLTAEQLVKMAEEGVVMPHLTRKTRFIKRVVNNYANVSTPSEGIFTLSEYNRQLGYSSYFSFFTVHGEYLYAAEWLSSGENPRFDSGAAIAKTGKKNEAGKQPLYILYADGSVRELPVSITEATQFYDGVAKVEYSEGRNKGVYYINTMGEKILPSLAMDYTYQNKMDMTIKGGARYLKDGRRAYYDNIKRRWGYLDREGKVVLPPIYVEVRDFANGYALVISKGQDGEYPVFIDIEGKEIVRPPVSASRLMYVKNISDISDGMFVDYSKSTYYNLQGKALNTYAMATKFFDGYAFVTPSDNEYFTAINNHFTPQRLMPLKYIHQSVESAFEYSGSGVVTVDNDKVFTADGHLVMVAGSAYPRNGKVGKFSDDGYATFEATLEMDNNSRTYYGITNIYGDATVVFCNNPGNIDRGNLPEPVEPPVVDDPPGYDDPPGEEDPPRGPKQVNTVTYDIEVIAVPAEAAVATGSGQYKYGTKVKIGGEINKGWLLSGIENVNPITLVGKGSDYEVRGNGQLKLLFVKEEDLTAGKGAFEGVLSVAKLNGQIMEAPNMTVYLEMSPDNSYSSPYGANTAGVLTVINNPEEVLKGQLRSGGKPKEGSLVTFNYFPVPMKVQGVSRGDDGRQWLVFDGGSNIMANTRIISAGAKSAQVNSFEALMFNFMFLFDNVDNVQLTPAHYRVEMKEIDSSTGAFTFGELQRLSPYGWVPGGDKRVTSVQRGFFVTKHDPGLPADYLTGVRMSPTDAGRRLQWTPPTGFYHDPSTAETVAKNLGEKFRSFTSQYDIMKNVNIHTVNEALDRLFK
ncbi:MAG: WG repeat-containing protein [Muribaculaceae bacterium]|nr:WG repeat-containing protein [Muribaculaceae bacterium]